MYRKNVIKSNIYRKTLYKKVIDEKFNKPIERNPDLSKFDINICHLCNEKIEDNPVKNHCHYSGKMLGYAHNECNLQYEFKKDNVHNDYLINIFGHNCQNFDQSFLIRALQNLDNKIPFSCLPRNSNKFISIQIGPFIFKDTYLFLNKSLDYLTGTINDEDRISLKQEFGEENYKLLTKKEYTHMITLMKNKNTVKQNYLKNNNSLIN